MITGLKPLVWVGASRRELLALPDDVLSVMGYGLYLAQSGGKHRDAKPFKGVGSGVFEIVDRLDGDTYRTLYVASLSDAIYVLHAFEKKSKRGIATPKHTVDLIRQRLGEARRIHAERTNEKTRK